MTDKSGIKRIRADQARILFIRFMTIEYSQSINGWFSLTYLKTV